MKVRLDERSLVTLTFLAGAAGALALATRMGPVARRVPIVVAAVTTGLLLRQAWVDLGGRRAEAQAEADPARRAREAALLGSLAALVALLWAFGPAPAVTLFVLLYLRALGREGWPAALAFAAGIGVTLHAVFGTLLGLRLYDGRVALWLTGHWR